MNTVIRLNNVFLIILCAFYSLDCHATKTNNSGFAKGCFGVAAGAALLGAAALVANYFTHPTDQEQFDSAVCQYNTLRGKYAWALDRFVDSFCIHNLSYYEKQRILETCNEDFLNHVAWTVWLNSHSVVSLPETLFQEASLFDTCLRDLTNRLNILKARQHPSYNEVALIHEISNFLGSVSYSAELFVLFADYCKKYSSYFALSDFSWHVYNQYESELAIIDKYRYDMCQLMASLNDIIVNKNNDHCCGSDCRYPYIRYVESLDSRLLKLEAMRNKSAFLYPLRVSWIDTVIIQQLKWLRVTLDPYYQSELLYQRRLQLDEEIIALRNKQAMHDIARLELSRQALDYEYGNAIGKLVIQIH